MQLSVAVYRWMRAYFDRYLPSYVKELDGLTDGFDCALARCRSHYRAFKTNGKQL